MKLYNEEVQHVYTLFEEQLTEVKSMFGQALKLEDVNFMIYPTGKTGSADGGSERLLDQGTYFISKEAAEREAEKRRLRQLARVRMTESWGNERPDWENAIQEKWVILSNCRIEDSCELDLLYFRLEEHAQAFVDEVGVDGIKLIWEL